MFKLRKKPVADTTATTPNEDENARAMLEAIDREMATIHFELDGTIVKANDKFLQAVGYRLDEIEGRNDSLFVDPTYAASSEYQQFWANLNAGEFQSGEFQRFRKDGSEIWLQASYNPLFDNDGRPIGVVKFASDITESIRLRQRTSEVGNAVATSIAQMVETIAEISGNVNQTADLATSTTTQVDATTASVQELDESSKTIENVVELIRNLADQTNLLALNATIESARAGDAGKGFAVVANEVKELAKQTSNATESIDNAVTAIRASVSEVVKLTGSVGESIRNVADNMTSIAAAVDEQSVTTSTISDTATQLQ